MGKIAEHYIGTMAGSEPLLDWVKSGSSWRNSAVFDQCNQIEYLKKIALIEDGEARVLLLQLVTIATRAEDKLTEVRREFETLHMALTNIDSQL